MSAKTVMQDVRHNDATMTNSIPPTKRGRRAKRNPQGHGYGAGDAMPLPGAGRKGHYESELVARDHCCGIHGAARERKGIKKGTSAARRRYEKELIDQELGNSL